MNVAGKTLKFNFADAALLAELCSMVCFGAEPKLVEETLPTMFLDIHFLEIIFSRVHIPS